jgi:cell division protein FtsZ
VATVVVGTVIDQEMSDDLKVTVVATGLGESARPNVVVDNTTPMLGLDGQPDYRQLDRPAYARHNAALRQDNLAEDLEGENMDYLDIPAFLRRQAD